MPDTPVTVTRGSVDALAAEVAGLRSAYANYRKFLIAACVVIVALIVGFIWLWVVAENAKSAVNAVEASQTTNCQNANDTRGNQRRVWDFVLDLSAADAGPSETAALESIRTWIHDVFANRDCSDLSQRYTVPVPPDVQQLLQQVKKDRDS